MGRELAFTSFPLALSEPFAPNLGVVFEFLPGGSCLEELGACFDEDDFDFLVPDVEGAMPCCLVGGLRRE